MGERGVSNPQPLDSQSIASLFKQSAAHVTNMCQNRLKMAETMVKGLKEGLKVNR